VLVGVGVLCCVVVVVVLNVADTKNMDQDMYDCVCETCLAINDDGRSFKKTQYYEHRRSNHHQ
jgi:hypothetical protein